MITIIPKAEFSDKSYIKDLEDELQKEKADSVTPDEKKIEALKKEKLAAEENAAYEEAEQPQATKPEPELA